jgi:hypothetical protein
MPTTYDLAKTATGPHLQDDSHTNWPSPVLLEFAPTDDLRLARCRPAGTVRAREAGKCATMERRIGWLSALCDQTNTDES